jgi:Tfp pilus assembly protein PilX
MKRPNLPPRARRRGGAIIGVLFFLLIISILLMGSGTFAVSHQTRAKVDADYAAAVDVAEAGINYEFRHVSTTGNTPHAWQNNGTNPAGYGPITFTTANGTIGQFWVYCTTNPNGNPPPAWTPPNSGLIVVATGKVGNTTRTIRASGIGYTVNGNYAVYGIHSVDLGSNSLVVGDVGSNGTITKGNSVSISGSVYLNGPSAAFVGTGTSVVNNPFPLEWETVSEKALALYPNSGATAPGGLSYIATHSANSRAFPPIINNTITGDVTLTGPGDYYITSCNMNGNDQIRFDNRNGPIRVWFGPAGAATSVTFRGTTDGATSVANGGHQVDMYIATRGQATLDMRGNATIRANIYDYNKDANDLEYGGIELRGTPDVYGSVLAYDVAFNGTPGVHYVDGVQQPDVIGYFGFGSSWAEVNPR